MYQNGEKEEKRKEAKTQPMTKKSVSHRLLLLWRRDKDAIAKEKENPEMGGKSEYFAILDETNEEVKDGR